MHNSNKYFSLMGLLLLSFVGIIALVAILFFVLRLFSIAVFNIPGANYIYQLLITTIPYLILFAAYYLVHKQISLSKKNTAAVLARIILTIGSLVCVLGLIFSLLIFFKTPGKWLTYYNEYSNLSFAVHLIIVLISAGVLATGDEKQKNWMER